LETDLTSFMQATNLSWAEIQNLYSQSLLNANLTGWESDDNVGKDFLTAASHVMNQTTANFNSQRWGFGLYGFFIQNGERNNPITAYSQQLSNPNLYLQTNTTVVSLTFDASCAGQSTCNVKTINYVTGRCNGGSCSPISLDISGFNSKVILTAGGINNANILLKSQITSSTLGTNLFDSITVEGFWPSIDYTNLDSRRSLQADVSSYINNPAAGAILSSPGFTTGGFVKRNPSDSTNKKALQFTAMGTEKTRAGVSMFVTLHNGDTRGTVTLATGSSSTVVVSYSPSSTDIADLVWGLSVAQNISQAPPFLSTATNTSGTLEARTSPGSVTPTDVTQFYVQNNNWGGTTKAGTSSSSSVVDSNLKVWNVNNLWIGDISVLPDPLTGDPTLTNDLIARYLVSKLT